MSRGGFRVDPDELHRLAGEFDSAANRLAGALSRFTASAQLPAGAFGLLPQARGAHEAYGARAREAAEGLRTVHGAFGVSLAGGVRACADNYVRSDGESVAGRS